jgi:peptide/nickel transport system ATP-binding protein
VGPAAHPERTVCVEKDPALYDVGSGHGAACHFAGADLHHPTNR